MLIRDEFVREKTVLLVNDVPVKGEVDPRQKEDTYGDKFSAISNMNLLTAFRKGTLNIYAKNLDTELPTIKSKDIATTYLDYSYYGEPELEKNFDFNKEFRKRKQLEVDGDNFYEIVEGQVNLFYKLEHQNDVYVSDRLYFQFLALVDEIRRIRPKLIIVTGKWSLFFLTGCSTLTANISKPSAPKPFGALAKFRSSVLQVSSLWNIEHEHVLVPIYHTVNAMSMPDKAYIMDLDIQKLCWMKQVIDEKGVEYFIRPEKEYVVGTTKEIIFDYLDEVLAVLALRPTFISIDIETFFMSTIDCIGLAYETNRGCCIPFASREQSSLWSIEDEIDIICKLREVLIHENCLHVGQNYSYDCQYFFKLWGLTITPYHDTMVLHHTLYNKLPKDLAFLASLYCEVYTYWKGEIDGTKENPETRWIYNAKDVCYTLEVLLTLLDILEAQEPELEEHYRFQIDMLHPELVTTMNRGVRVNIEMKEELFTFFRGIVDSIPERINSILGMNYNNNSTVQKKALFKDFFNITLKTVKKKGKEGMVETCDAKAMIQYVEEYPMLKPFLMVLLEFSALSKFTNTFLGMKLDLDGRMRTQYKIAGTNLGRLASVKNVWGKGGNLQNLPEKGKVPIFYLLQLLDDTFAVEKLEEDTMEFIEHIEYEEDTYAI